MFLLMLAPVASADIAPPPGYVEQCTVARVQKDNPGQTCVSCDAWHGGRADCETREAEGYVKRCKSRGASTWSEVLCKAGTPEANLAAEAPPAAEAPAAAADPAEDATPAGCQVAPGAPIGWPGMALGLLLLRSRVRSA